MVAKVNVQAPEFSLKDSQGLIRELSEFKGKKVVLYFFPRSDTPGCTKEACTFRDSNNLYNENNIVVLGVSYDSPETLAAFKEKYNLPFILLSDSEKKVAREYGAYKSLLNALYPERITFLINQQGIITHELTHVDVSTHASDILKLFNATKQS